MNHCFLQTDTTRASDPLRPKLSLPRPFEFLSNELKRAADYNGVLGLHSNPYPYVGRQRCRSQMTAHMNELSLDLPDPVIGRFRLFKATKK